LGLRLLVDLVLCCFDQILQSNIKAVLFQIISGWLALQAGQRLGGLRR
jgi:hypothetical protein